MDQTLILLYIILGALAGIIYGIRKVYFLETKLAALELKIDKILEHHKPKKRRK
jgi:uncharacterized protein YneF (UPF0154 family)